MSTNNELTDSRSHVPAWERGNMGSTELAANLFRATQTEEKLKREGVKEKSLANQTHHEVGVKVCQTIQELGGTMPEDLPCSSIRQEEVSHG